MTSSDVVILVLLIMIAAYGGFKSPVLTFSALALGLASATTSWGQAIVGALTSFAGFLISALGAISS